MKLAKSISSDLGSLTYEIWKMRGNILSSFYVQIDFKDIDEDISTIKFFSNTTLTKEEVL